MNTYIFSIFMLFSSIYSLQAQEKKLDREQIVEKNEISKVYKARLYFSRFYKDNPKISLYNSESFNLKNGLEIPKGTHLVAYADFTNGLSFNIKSIIIEDKIIKTNIQVLDYDGQEYFSKYEKKGIIYLFEKKVFLKLNEDYEDRRK